MVDTVKIYTMIDKNIYDIIRNKSIIKTSYSLETGEIFYTITNDHLKGSYDSSLSVVVGGGAKYKFVNKYFIEIEGSYHKIVRGYNSHNGFYNVYSICSNLVKLVEYSYNIKLPCMKHWFLSRIDIAICYDLKNQNNVENYLYNLRCCRFPRRDLERHKEYGSSVYVPGATTTLKIYNKYAEFMKHDLKKFKCSDFDINKYLSEISGYIRFECELHKRKLKNIYKGNFVRIRNVSYLDLKNVWSEEFMKLLGYYECELQVVREKEKVKRRIFSVYGDRKGQTLYNFYCSLVLDGVEQIKRITTKSTYYRNIKCLKDIGIDYSQKLEIVEDNSIIDFNPFQCEEVA